MNKETAPTSESYQEKSLHIKITNVGGIEYKIVEPKKSNSDWKKAIPDENQDLPKELPIPLKSFIEQHDQAIEEKFPKPQKAFSAREVSLQLNNLPLEKIIFSDSCFEFEVAGHDPEKNYLFLRMRIDDSEFSGIFLHLDPDFAFFTEGKERPSFRA